MENDLISRSNLWTDIMMLPHNGDIISSEEVEQAIVDAPAVDAVKVVRCKDCKHWDDGTGFCDEHSHFFSDGMCWDAFNENDFCSYGERRTENAAD